MSILDSICGGGGIGGIGGISGGGGLGDFGVGNALGGVLGMFKNLLSGNGGNMLGGMLSGNNMLSGNSMLGGNDLFSSNCTNTNNFYSQQQQLASEQEYQRIANLNNNAALLNTLNLQRQQASTVQAPFDARAALNAKLLSARLGGRP